MAKTFPSFGAALALGKTYGKEWVLPCYKWVVEMIGPGKYGIAIKSKSTGATIEWVTA